MVDWTQIIISLCALVITGILIPLVKHFVTKAKVEIDTTLSAEERQLVYNIVETGVRWARQWLQSKTGKKKKEEVLKFVSEQFEKLNIVVDPDYLDKLIESIYDEVKHESEVIEIG